MRETCIVDAANSDFVCLGTVVGSAAGRCEQFRDCVGKINDVRDKVLTLMDPAVELILGRVSVNVNRVVHLLRTAGTDLTVGACGLFDVAQLHFVERALAGDLPDAAHDQAALGVHAGVLGMRRARAMRLTASVASRIESRPGVAGLFATMDSRGFGLPRCLERFDGALLADVGALMSEFPDELAGDVRGFIDRAAAAAEERFQSMLRGAMASGRGPPVGPQHAGARLVHEYGTEDFEHPSVSERQPRLQHGLSKLADRLAARRLRDDASGADATRPNDLADPSTDHD